jgi:HSP20 family molecular chaperone IbpA
VDLFSNESITVSRTISLSKDIDTEKIEASLKDGILYLAFPKFEKPGPKKIELKKEFNFEKLID